MSKRLCLSMSILLLFFLSACGPGATPTPYLPPTPVQSLTPVQTRTPTISITESIPVEECENNLTFMDDLTIPDGSIVQPGTILDKQWSVLNSGTCDWNGTYRLRFTNGSLMGAVEEQALYPARAGTQAALRVLFTAPAEAGEYVSIWQAFGPDGLPFGEGFLIKIIVQP